MSTAPREASNDTAPSLSLQNGGTPLLYAVRGNHVKCVEALLGNGEDLCLNSLALKITACW